MEGGEKLSPSSEKENMVPEEEVQTNEQVQEDQEEEECEQSSYGAVKITAEMLAEEEELEKQREQRQLEEDEEERKREKARKEEEDTEKRLKRLAVLLDQSEFFSQFIAQRMSEQKDTVMSTGGEKKKGRKPGRKSKDKQLMEDKALLDSLSKEKRLGQGSQEDLVVSSGTRTTPMGIEVSERQPFLLEGASMRDYQLDGYEWLKLLYINGVNGILADEMGLGKTIQTIALTCFMVEQRLQGPYLIVAPLSTLANWINEFNAFCPRIPVVMYHGTQDERREMAKQLNKMHKVQCDGFEASTYPVVVTSYEVAMRDRDTLQRRQWEMVAVDEGHRIKNHQCRLARELRMYNSKCRLLLTGTPLQNDLRELWALLNYLIPDVFADLSAFESWFEVKELSNEGGNFEESNQKIIDREQKNHIISKLHKILQPFMLRRMKSDVNLGLPPKKEILVFTPMTPDQNELYKHLLEKTIHEKLIKEREKLERKQEIEEEVAGPPSKRLRRSAQAVTYDMDTLSPAEFEKRYNANLEKHTNVKVESKTSFKQHCIEQGVITRLNPGRVMVDLRKAVNHPYLIQMPLIPGTEEPLIDENLVNKAGKMLVLDAMLAKLKEKGHKVLIFSQWTTVLDFIEDFMHLRGYRYCRLDGTTKISDRVESISQFNKDPKIFAFLLSTRAGGLGINLTAADTVIIYDSDWNPQCDLQAQDRCHRIGQTRPVVVYRLTTDGTIDRRMVERATGKRRLEKLIIKQGHFAGNQRKLTRLDQSGEFSPEDLLRLLNSKDYSRSVQSNGFVFSDEELEQLLDRSDMMPTSDKDEVVEKKALKRKIGSPQTNKQLFAVI